MPDADTTVVVVGHTITKHAFYVHSDGTPAVPVAPKYSIVNPFGVTVVLLADPTWAGDIDGHYFAQYAVPPDAPLGGWTILWYGTIDGAPRDDPDVFTVVAEGSIVFPGSGNVGDTCSGWCVPSDLRCDLDGVSDDDIALWIQVASNILNRAVGSIWPGTCIDTIRPCGYNSTRRWGKVGWCGCYDSAQCGCRRISQLMLPGWPVVAIDEVVIDGDVLDTDRYRLDDYRLLVYLPAEDDVRFGWPCCQRLDLDDSEADTWSVTYRWGRPPPTDGKVIAAAYACELIKAAGNDSDCALPEDVVSVAQQGLTYSVADPQQLLTNGQTGFAAADAWIGNVLAGRDRKGAVVHLSSPPRGQHSARRPGTS